MSTSSITWTTLGGFCVQRTFRAHQLKIAEHIRKVQWGGVWAGMGSGKTASGLLSMVRMREDFECLRPMVIAPLRVARSAWPDEIADWPEFSGFTYEVVTGQTPKHERTELLEKSHFLTIVNKEMFPAIVQNLHAEAVHDLFPEVSSIYEKVAKRSKMKFFYKYKTYGEASYAVATRSQPLKAWINLHTILEVKKPPTSYFNDVADRFGEMFRWDWLFFDDTPLRSENTSRWRAARYVRPFVTGLIQMTGTPSPKSLTDTWAQAYIMDGGERLGSYKSHFLQTYFIPGKGFGQYHPKSGAGDAIANALSDRVYSLTEEEYAKLPPRNELYEKVAIPETMIKKYNAFRRDMILKAEESGKEITAVNAAVLANKLLQWCSGAIYDENKEVHHVHDYKLNALKELIDDNPDENFLVAYTYKHELDRILSKIPYAVVLDTDPNTIKRWNNKEIRVLLAHPKSAGHGLNLQHGGRNAVWFSLTYDLELWLQFNKRLHRGDQKQPVNIIHLIIPGTQEERVVDVLKQKCTVQDFLMRTVKSGGDILPPQKTTKRLKGK